MRRRRGLGTTAGMLREFLSHFVVGPSITSCGQSYRKIGSWREAPFPSSPFRGCHLERSERSRPSRRSVAQVLRFAQDDNVFPSMAVCSQDNAFGSALINPLRHYNRPVKNLGILLSGRGSNCVAIADSNEAGRIPEG